MKKSRILFLVVATATLTSVGAAQNLEISSSTLWNTIHGIQIVGSYAYCTYEAGLKIIDVSNPNNPNEIGKYCSTNGFQVWGICISGNLAFLANDVAGVTLLDISNPLNPRFVSQSETPGIAREIASRNNFLYVADSDAGVVIFNISDPNNPIELGSIDNGSALDIKARENYVYVAGYWAGLQIIDVSNPSNPVMAGTYPGQPVESVDLVGNVAYLGMGYAHGLITVDISNPNSPTVMGQASFGEDCWGIKVLGSYAYVAEILGDLHIINVSNPRIPSLLSTLSVPGYGYKIGVSGNYAYLCSIPNGDRFDGLTVINITNRTSPMAMGTLYSSGGPNNINSNDNYLYVSSTKETECFNLSNPSQPEFVYGNADFPAVNSSFMDHYLIATGRYSDNWGIQIFDLINPVSPQLISSLSVGYGADDICINGTYAYIKANHYYGGGYSFPALYTIDIQDPFHPEICSYVFEDFNDIIVIDSLAYLTSLYGGLAIYNVANAHAPLPLGDFNTSISAAGVRVRDNYAYVGDRVSTLQIIDISDVLHPEFVGACTTSFPTTSIDVCGNYAFVAGGVAGVRVVDISNPTNPQIIDEFNTPGEANDILVRNNYIYIADRYSLITLISPYVGIDSDIETPNTFSLSQNYPNPFNPATTIKYDLPSPCRVRIDIYDILGRRVATLADEEQPAGVHQAIWNAQDKSSGIYFYRIQAGEFVETKKMMLMK
jgi:hypothetical protein